MTHSILENERKIKIIKDREMTVVHDCQQEFQETDLKIRELKTILQRITPADDRHTIIQTETLTQL